MVKLFDQTINIHIESSYRDGTSPSLFEHQ